jgi:hypothetical protein
LAIVLSVLVRFTDSDYPFGIFRLFLACLLNILTLSVPDEGYSTDNTMAKRKRKKVKAAIYKTLHRKLKIEQHETYKKLMVNSGAPEDPFGIFRLFLACLLNILTLSVPDEGYSRNASRALSSISTFLLHPAY